jgi:hypothetical protein
MRELREARHDPNLWKGGWAGDTVIGQVLSVIGKAARRSSRSACAPPGGGAAWPGALLLRALRGIQARDIAEIRLHTRDNSPTRAKDLYVDVGFRVLEKFPRDRKPLLAGPGSGA